MATAGRIGRFRRHPPKPSRTFTVSSPGRSGPWSLTSSAARLDVSDKGEAKVQRMLRQGWQSDAWAFRDSIGELRYAVKFLANCTARMRVYPAIYPLGGESDAPVALDKAPDVPAQVISAAGQAISDLGNDRNAISGLLSMASENKSVAGESYLVGRTDQQTGEQRWSMRSVDELVVVDDKWHLREIPDDRQNGVIPWIALEPEFTVISRIWTPHPRFQLLADSPLRAMLDDCESLMILRRMIRATGRSRLARSGIMAIPDGFSIKVPTDDDQDPDADPFMAALEQAMSVPIADEGVASVAVPIVIRGPGDEIAKIKIINLSGEFDAQASKTREELIGIIATSFDLPKEVIMGISDLNHWSAWQVDDNVFRHHVEPHVISVCDDLSAAYLRPYLAAKGVPDMWVQRMAFWYDATELVTHPDRADDAEKAYAAMTISGKAYRAATGFAEEDAPTVQELEMRRVMDIRALPLNLLMEYASRADPTLIVPAMTGPPQLPGIKPGGGVDVGADGQPKPGAPVLPGTVPSAGVPALPKPTTAPPGPPPAASAPTPAPPLTAAAGMSATNARLSRRLAAIDATLRARLQTAANAAMLRQLERAGARLRPKVAKDETLRTKIAHRANERVSALLGPDVVTAAGLSAAELMGSDWSGLRSQFYEWTQAAQQQALKTALRIGGLQEDSAAATAAQTAMASGRDAAWDLLSESLTALGHSLLYSPDPNVGPGDWADLNPDSIVPTGMIRAALGVAGGAPASSVTLDAPTGVLSTTGYVGQIGTGSTVSDLLTSAGGETAQFEWQHGPSIKSFEPHEALDGVQFVNFDDDALANPGDWPPVAYLMPGDHQGCLCDAAPLWDFPGNPLNDSSADDA